MSRAVDDIELVASVYGRVQGVGFRATAKSLADELHLKGFVRNLADGSVKICAQGAKDRLELFLFRLKAKFPSDHIAHIETDFRQPLQKYAEFKIVR